MSSITCHTLGGFKGGFFVQHGRPPTEQEIFNAGMRGGRDIIWPKHMVNNPTNQEIVAIDKKILDELMLIYCAFAPIDDIPKIREALGEFGKREDTSSYVRGVPTAIGGTLHSQGRNIFWQVSVVTVEELPETARIGSKGFVTSTESVYDITDKGWVLNEADTAFIKKGTVFPPRGLANTTGKVSALNTPEHLKRADGDYLKP